MEEIQRNLGSISFKSADGNWLGASEITLLYDSFKTVCPNEATSSEAFQQYVVKETSSAKSRDDGVSKMKFEEYLPIRYGLIASVMGEDATIAEIEKVEKQLEKNTSKLERYCQQSGCDMVVPGCLKKINAAIMDRLKIKKSSHEDHSSVKIGVSSTQENIEIKLAYKEVDERIPRKDETDMGSGLLEIDTALLRNNNNSTEPGPVLQSLIQIGQLLDKRDASVNESSDSKTIVLTPKILNELLEKEEAKIRARGQDPAEILRGGKKKKEKEKSGTSPLHFGNKDQNRYEVLTPEKLDSLIEEEKQKMASKSRQKISKPQMSIAAKSDLQDGKYPILTQEKLDSLIEEEKQKMASKTRQKISKSQMSIAAKSDSPSDEYPILTMEHLDKLIAESERDEHNNSRGSISDQQPLTISRLEQILDSEERKAKEIQGIGRLDTHNRSSLIKGHEQKGGQNEKITMNDLITIVKASEQRQQMQSQSQEPESIMSRFPEIPTVDIKHLHEMMARDAKTLAVSSSSSTASPKVADKKKVPSTKEAQPKHYAFAKELLKSIQSDLKASQHTEFSLLIPSGWLKRKASEIPEQEIKHHVLTDNIFKEGATIASNMKSNYFAISSKANTGRMYVSDTKKKAEITSETAVIENKTGTKRFSASVIDISLI